jgi:aspartokinase/homoserine dehydrogenase 1
MSAVLDDPIAAATPQATPAIALVLLGTGVVGGAFLRLLNTPAAASLRLVGVANSRRQQTDAASLASRGVRDQLNNTGDVRDNTLLLAALDASNAGAKVIVDATRVATCGMAGAWLSRGHRQQGARRW